MILLSFVDHTPVRLAYYPERQARGRGDTRYDQRSHGGVRDIYRKYAQRGGNADGESGVNKKAISPKSGIALILFLTVCRWRNTNFIFEDIGKISRIAKANREGDFGHSKI